VKGERGGGMFIKKLKLIWRIRERKSASIFLIGVSKKRCIYKIA